MQDHLYVGFFPRGYRGRTINITISIPHQRNELNIISLIDGVEGFETPYQLPGRNFKLTRGSRRRTVYMHKLLSCTPTGSQGSTFQHVYVPLRSLQIWCNYGGAPLLFTIPKSTATGE